MGCLVLIVTGLVHAGGLREVSFIPSMPSMEIVNVDGSLKEWQGVEKVKYVPLRAFGATDLGGGREDLAVSIATTYDADAMYVALDWLSTSRPTNTASPSDAVGWEKSGDGVAMHLNVGRNVIHVVSYPSVDGETASLLMRVGNDPDWTDLTKSDGQAAVAMKDDGKGYVQEIKIPWQALHTKNNKPFVGHLTWALDLVWAELAKMPIAAIDAGVRVSACHTTYDILTSKERLYTSGYLSNSEDWGKLVLGTESVNTHTIKSNMGTGAVKLVAPLVGQQVLIDGKLPENEWKPSTYIQGSRMPKYLGDRFACNIAAQYDQNQVYLAARFPSIDKPYNTAVEREQNGFNGGDCLQIRMAYQGKRVNLCGWYDMKSKMPALTSDGKDLQVPFLMKRGAKMAISADPNGGYVMEMAIPWKLLFPSTQVPATGEVINATFQPWWVGANRQFAIYGKLEMVNRGPLTVNYEMPCDAEVSLGVFDQDGTLIRWLTRSDFRRAGKNTEYWDGRDQRGKPLMPGTYRVKAIYHDPLKTSYKGTVGNPGTPPWPTADGKGDWLSDESDPQAAATDGKWVYLASPGCEKGWSIIAVDENGQRQWGVGVYFYPRCVTLALHGDYLYALYSGPELTDTAGSYNGKNAHGRAILMCLDKHTGKQARFSMTDPSKQIHTFPYNENMIGLWDLFNNKSFEPGVYGGKPRYADIDFGEATNAIGLGVTSKTVYVSMYFENRLAAYNVLTGEPMPKLNITIPKPVGIHVLDDQNMLVVSDGHVFKIDVNTKETTPLITEGLAAPHSLTTDRHGNIYVSDWKDSFQVKVFSSTGSFLRAIGKKGGRPVVGKWDNNGMLLPRGIAVTDEGKLWVTEDDGTPPRVSVWDAQSGNFLTDYIGPLAYGGGSLFWGDPQDDTIVHTMGCKFKVDWDRKTYEPQEIEYRRLSINQPFTPSGRSLWGMNVRHFTREGHKYVGVSAGIASKTILMLKGDIWEPVAAFGTLHRWATTDGTDMVHWDSDLRRHMIKNRNPEFFRGHAGENYAWYDRNFNGLVEEDEMTWSKTIFRGDLYQKNKQPEFQNGWGRGMGPDWSVYLVGMCKDRHIIDRFDCLGWTSQGVPMYDISKFTEVDAVTQSVDGLYVNDENKLFAVGGLSWDLWTGKIPVSTSTLMCYERTGKQLWNVAAPTKQGAKDIFSSNVQGEFNIPGIGNVVCTWHWWGNWRPYIISSDGMYVGTVLDEGKVGPAGLWDESLNYFYQGPDGKLYVINGGNDAQHFMEIKGFENAGRFELTLIFSGDDAKLAASTIRDSQSEKVEQMNLAMRWPSTSNIKIDGQFDDWEGVSSNTLDGGDGYKATVSLRRDSENLYLAYHVNDSSPMMNMGGNWQTLFITGDCVDLMLATDPNADKNRAAAAQGDQRLLISVFQEKPIAVLYRPVMKNLKSKPVQMMATTIDQVLKLTDANIAFSRGHDYYNVEASIPLNSLGLNSFKAQSIKGDVGIIFSDETGRDRVKRLYYYNKQTSMTADLTTEATLQPSLWGSIQMPLGKNLILNGGFEGDLASSPKQGWAVEHALNGMSAELTSEPLHGGQQALAFIQTKPVVYPEEMFNEEDYGKFLRSANGGKGGGSACVFQEVPVESGKKYSFRYHYHAQDMKGESKGKGKERGYTSLKTWLYFYGGKGGRIWAANDQGNTEKWVAKIDPVNNHSGVPQHYEAPEGAKYVKICFYGVCNAPAVLPIMSLDDVEFVEVDE